VQSETQIRRYRFGEFEIDLVEGELRRRGMRLKLNEKPFQVLCVLLEGAGHLVTRDELRQRLWTADTYVDFDANLNTALSTLRHKLGDSSDNPAFIETIPRHGYRFIAPVTPFPEEENDAAPSQGVEENRESALQGQTSSSIPLNKWRRPLGRVLSFAVFLCLVIAAAALTWVNYFHWQGRPAQGKLTILVTPFENLSGDINQEYLGDGLTDEMITRMGQISPAHLSVIARSTAMRYKHTQKAVDQIAQESRADYVLEGSVRRQDDRIRISAQLFRAGEQGSLWTEAYDRDSRGLLIIQQEVADRIAHSLSLEVLPAVPGNLATNPINPEAYDAYLKGLFELNKRTQEDLRRSISYFQQAMVNDDKFAPAYAALASSYSVAAGWAFLSPRESYPRAKVAAQRALSLDETLADAHAAYAEILHNYEWEWDNAEREYQRALQLNPSSANGHKVYAEYLTHAGRYTDALAEIRKAQTLDPASLVMSAFVCYVYYHAREYDTAISECGKVLELDPNFMPAHYWRGASRVFTGRYQEAAEDFHRAAELSENASYFLTWMALNYALEGRNAQSREMLQQLNVDSHQRYVSPYGLASVHLALGEREQAIALLERATRERATDTLFLATAQEFDALHDDTRFDRMMRMVKFPRSAISLAATHPPRSR
jgi:TolB-like protein/DNA-binding winged helix-turn-helix (wHTH) protein/Tfp pilus assembly protein PilF